VNGRAYLFCGRSGSGKTTIARLSPMRRLLSDEALHREACRGDGALSRHAVWGELARAGEEPRRAAGGNLFPPSREPARRGAIKPRQALERLLPNILFLRPRGGLTGQVLSIAADLVEAVPCFDLAFRPTPASGGSSTVPERYPTEIPDGVASLRRARPSFSSPRTAR